MKPFKYSLPNCVEVQLMVLRDSQAGKPVCDTPERVADYYNQVIRATLLNPDVECFHVVFLNTRRRATGYVLVSTGNIDTLLVHPREVFRPAILAGAAAIILLHNHPSGDAAPSEADIKITRDLIRAGQLLKIEVLDHLVMGEKTDGHPGYNSLRELGYFFTT